MPLPAHWNVCRSVRSGGFETYNRAHMSRIKIAPSLLAADFALLGEEVARVERSVDWLHLDVMDGHFVPNLSFGIPVIAALREQSALYFDCHLMTTNPDAFLPELAEAGVDLVTMHIEAIPDPTVAIRRARSEELDVGLVINPGTPVAAVLPFLELVDVVLVMSVEPGFGGQPLISEVLGKVEKLRETVENSGFLTDIEIDGGITPENIGRAADAGAHVFVAGTAIFGAEDPVDAVRELRRTIEGK
jgi:ribulose-phosphate 3-epimerase